MKISRPPRNFIAACALAACACPALATGPDPVDGSSLLAYRGEARAPEGGALLYVEDHLLRSNGEELSERLVLYRCADGTPFARKQVDYAENPLAPAFKLVDARLDYREGLRREASRLHTFGGIGEPRETTLGAAGALVADAGFDRFVSQNWLRLQAGEAVPLDFLVPSRGRSYGFRVRKVEDIEVDGAAASRVRLSLGGVFGLFAPPIDVIYRDADQWLLRFEGMTNIRADARNNLVAHIEFPDSPQPVDAEQWAQASAEPLQSCALPASG